MHLYQEYVGDLNLVPISTLNHCVMLSTPLSLSVPVFLIYKADLMHFSFYYFLIIFFTSVPQVMGYLFCTMLKV